MLDLKMREVSIGIIGSVVLLSTFGASVYIGFVQLPFYYIASAALGYVIGYPLFRCDQLRRFFLAAPKPNLIVLLFGWYVAGVVTCGIGYLIGLGIGYVL